MLKVLMRFAISCDLKCACFERCKQSNGQKRWQTCSMDFEATAQMDPYGRYCRRTYDGFILVFAVKKYVSLDALSNRVFLLKFISK